MSKNKYHRSTGQEGLDHRRALNQFINSATQQFVLGSGLKEGMRVLDLGCGIGIMSAWLAEQVGPDGKVVAIDNSADQLEIAKEVAKDHDIKNIEFVNCFAKDIASLNQEFDYVFCRFLMVHLVDPRLVLQAIYDCLAKGGVFACETAIVGHEYCYPPSEAFNSWRQLNHDILAQTNRDPQTGKKLFNYCHEIGFHSMDARIFQPVLSSVDLRREMILNDLAEQEAAMLEVDLIDEEQLNDLREELTDFCEDESVFIAFTPSAQVFAVK